ncbi:MAG TPA: transporter substrate-binding domain-containing protein [Paucimonas sp.]|nr:transporter substrate-binding domain-containing protein [Paucimonas sp.]
MADEPQWQFYTEEYPPVTFSRGGKATGLATEIVEELMRRLGVSAPIEVVPWARGYKLATTMPNVGLFATTRTEEREKLFKWVGPISATTAHFYGRRGGPRYESLEQARGAERILIPREWYLEQMLRGMRFTNINPVATPSEAVRMLAAGRAPLMALDDVTLADTLSALGIDAGGIEKTGATITQAIQYIAFSRGTPDDVVGRWQKALDGMKADGSYERIYAKWLPGVKPPEAR